MKIYTKKGDEGETSLFGGTRLPKNDIRIEAYGTVDELNSFIGMIRNSKLDAHTEKIIVTIQEDLFTIGAMLASDNHSGKAKIPKIQEESIALLENEIDKMEENLSPMKNFILPGGNPVVSACHISRSICRRAERTVITLSKNNVVDKNIIRYLNRLSDYLFVLARKVTKDFGAKEISWIPNI